MQENQVARESNWFSRLSRVYSLGLVTIAIFAAAGFYLAHISTLKESAGAKEVHLAAIYRTTGLKLLKEFFALDNFKGAPFQDRLREMRTERRALKQLQEELLTSDDIDVRNAFSSQTALQSDVSQVTRSIDEGTRGASSELDPDRYRSAAETVLKYEMRAEQDLDRLVTSLTHKEQHKAGFEQSLQVGIVLLTLLMLVIQGRFVFAPTIRKIRAGVELLQTRGDAAEEKYRFYVHENEMLRTEQEQLQEVAGKLEGANQRIELAARRFEELFQGLPIACFGYDSNGAIFEWNRAFSDMFQIEPSDLFRTTLFDLISSQSVLEDLRSIVDQVFLGESFSALNLQKTAGADKRYLLCSTFPVHGPNDQILGAIFSCVDVTFQKSYERQIEHQLLRINEYSVEIEQQKWELQEANERLESLASSDGLTGLLNHRSFQEGLAREYSRAIRSGTPLSLVFLDIDFFKLYNDSFGHPAGDALLKQLARTLVGCGREQDLVARYGGEEFVLILPATDEDGAILAADRMRLAIETMPNGLRPITASFGVATMSTLMAGPDQLILAADRALYAAKESGRNKVVHAGSLNLPAEHAA